MPSVTGRVRFFIDELPSLQRRCVTYRYYGPNKSLRRPMFHRFEVKGGFTVLEAFADNIVKHNALFRALCKKGK